MVGIEKVMFTPSRFVLPRFLFPPTIAQRYTPVSRIFAGLQALFRLLDVITPAMRREQEFLADFLQVTDSSLTFADYMNMEAYICRKASTSISEMRPSTVKLIRGAMDLIFGFLAEELRLWVDGALQRDSLCVEVFCRSDGRNLPTLALADKL